MILIVDDDPSFLETTDVLDPGHGIIHANNAKHAKELLTTLGAVLSVVLIDLDLPDANGFELMHEVREKSPSLPVIAISGVFQPNVLESARVFGAIASLRKPIGPDWIEVITRARAAHQPTEI